MRPTTRPYQPFLPPGATQPWGTQRQPRERSFSITLACSTCGQMPAYQERLAEVRASGATDAESWYNNQEARGAKDSWRTDCLPSNATAALALVAARARAENQSCRPGSRWQGMAALPTGTLSCWQNPAQTGLDQAEALHRAGALDALLSALALAARHRNGLGPTPRADGADAWMPRHCRRHGHIRGYPGRRPHPRVLLAPVQGGGARRRFRRHGAMPQAPARR